MAGRPWYIQTMDATHRLTVLGILGFSGYLGYIAFDGVRHNAMKKQHKEPVSGVELIEPTAEHKSN